MSLKKINGKIFNFYQECKENGELYGSIKPKQITNLIKEKINLELSPSLIVLKNDLNKIGNYEIEINFHPEVKAKISVRIDKPKSK